MSPMRVSNWSLGRVLVLVSAAMLANSARGYPPAAKGKSTPSKDPKPANTGSQAKMPALSFKMKDIDGKDQDLRKYYGNVVLMVNTASKCGYTPQYKGLETLYEKYRKKGLVVLAFPANDFNHQEPGSDSEIKEFCSTNFHVTFPIYSKVTVKGPKSCDLYKYLTNKNADHKFGGDIEWNFTKFLVNRNGEVIGRFNHDIAPENDALTQAVKKALAEALPADAPKGHGKSKGKHKN